MSLHDPRALRRPRPLAQTADPRRLRMHVGLWVGAALLAAVTGTQAETAPAPGMATAAPVAAESPVAPAPSTGAEPRGLQWRWMAGVAPTAPPSVQGPGLQRRDAPADWGRGVLASALVADYFLTGSGLGARIGGGLRATSGLLAPQGFRAPGLDGQPVPARSLGSALDPLPYVGLGWSGTSVEAGWGLQADFGVVATGGGLRLGRAALSGSADELLRDLRLTPVIRLGASYSF